VDVTPEYLTAFYKDRMDFEGAASVQRYLGKWMRLSGPLRNVEEETTFGLSWLQVTMQRSEPLVVMFFNDQKRFDRVKVLKRGDLISVLGRIHKVQRHGITLEDCELEGVG
jgi:hypothetical protein